MLILSQPPLVTLPSLWTLLAAISAASNNVATPPAIDTTGADLIIAVGTRYQVQPPVLSDTYNNTWLVAVSQDDTAIQGNEISATLYYVHNPIVGANHGFTWGAGSLYGVLSILAFKGSAPSDPVLDQTNGYDVGSGVSSIQAGVVTPSESNELIVAGLVQMVDGATGGTQGPPVSIDSSFVMEANFPLSGGQYFGGFSAYLLQKTAAPSNPSWSWPSVTGGGAAVIASFKAATQFSFDVPVSDANNGGSDYPNDIVIGENFTPTVNGRVTALKFYKPSTTLGDSITDTNTVHTVSLWAADGTQLAHVTTSNEPVGGWVTVPITAVTLTAGTAYVVSFWAAPPTGWIWISGVSGNISNSPYLVINNGQYNNGQGDVFPSVVVATDYWYADVVFEA